MYPPIIYITCTVLQYYRCSIILSIIVNVKQYLCLLITVSNQCVLIDSQTYSFHP